MAKIKTAISLSSSVYEAMDALARRARVPRSQLFELAAQELLEKHKSSNLARRINAAVSDQSERENIQQLALMKRKHRQLVEGQW